MWVMNEAVRVLRPSGGELHEGTNVRLFALSAKHNTAERADDADKSAAIRAGITLGGALFLAARSADHRVSFAEHSAHS
jgi:hypothetical protein